MGEVFKCEISGCTSSYRHKKSLTKHLKTHEANAVRYQCTHCEQTFSQDYDRRRHEWEQHSERRATERCPHCDRFMRPRALQEHLDKSCAKRLQSSSPLRLDPLVFEPMSMDLKIQAAEHSLPFDVDTLAEQAVSAVIPDFEGVVCQNRDDSELKQHPDRPAAISESSIDSGFASAPSSECRSLAVADQSAAVLDITTPNEVVPETEANTQFQPAGVSDLPAPPRSTPSPPPMAQISIDGACDVTCSPINTTTTDALITLGASNTTRRRRSEPDCIICGRPFELDKRELLGHLARHIRELSKPAFRCALCDIWFVYEADLRNHELCAQSAQSSCGYAFAHSEMCTGHHPPSPSHYIGFAPRQSEEKRALLSDHRRMLFWAGDLKGWEYAQLKAFMDDISLVQLLRSEAIRQYVPPPARRDYLSIPGTTVRAALASRAGTYSHGYLVKSATAVTYQSYAPPGSRWTHAVPGSRREVVCHMNRFTDHIAWRPKKTGMHAM